jgi:C_GCAxxG_C_C family probable redox protein
MTTRGETAVEMLLTNYNCAQAVLYAFCDDLGFDRDTALRMACGFGAGMARKQGVCGAISGGMLAIGLKYGRGQGQERAATEDTYEKVRELMSRFESKHGSCLCKTLLNGCDLNTPEGQQYFKENDLLNGVCARCVQTVVETLEELM